MYLRAGMRRLAVILAIGLSACASHGALPAIVRVAYKDVTDSGAVRYVEFDQAGNVRGGVVVGDSAPSVHEETGRIPSGDAVRLFADASQLGDTLLRQEGDAPAEPRGSQVIAVLFENGSQARIVWPEDRPHADARVQALLRQILAHKVGW